MERTAILGRLNWQIGTVVAIKQETPRVKSLTFMLPQWPGHRAGQHIDLRLTAEDGYQAQRSYSIASAPEEQSEIMITVEGISEGEVSPYLINELRIGDQVELRGPIGGYFVWESQIGGPLLLLAAGSGVVPLMAILRHRQATHSTVPTRLLYSSRSYRDIIYREEMEQMEGNDPTLEIIHTLTRSAPSDWQGYRRRVDRAMLQEVAWPAVQHPLAFLCGPTPFVESMASELLALEYEAARIRTERFGPTGG